MNHLRYEHEQAQFQSGATQEGSYLVDNASGLGVQYRITVRGTTTTVSTTTSDARLGRQDTTLSPRSHIFDIEVRLLKSSRPIKLGLSTFNHFKLRIFPAVGDNDSGLQAPSEWLAPKITTANTTCSLGPTVVRMNAASALQIVNNGNAAEQPFSVSLRCNNVASMYLTLTDAVSPSNTSTILAPSHSSTTEGVGFQILRNGTPVTLGTRWTHTTFVSDSNIDFTARYAKTRNTVLPGSLEGYATLTLVYR